MRLVETRHRLRCAPAPRASAGRCPSVAPTPRVVKGGETKTPRDPPGSGRREVRHHEELLRPLRPCPESPTGGSPPTACDPRRWARGRGWRRCTASGVTALIVLTRPEEEVLHTTEAGVLVGREERVRRGGEAEPLVEVTQLVDGGEGPSRRPRVALCVHAAEPLGDGLELHRAARGDPRGRDVAAHSELKRDGAVDAVVMVRGVAERRWHPRPAARVGDRRARWFAHETTGRRRGGVAVFVPPRRCYPPRR